MYCTTGVYKVKFIYFISDAYFYPKRTGKNQSTEDIMRESLAGWRTLFSRRKSPAELRALTRHITMPSTSAANARARLLKYQRMPEAVHSTTVTNRFHGVAPLARENL